MKKIILLAVSNGFLLELVTSCGLVLSNYTEDAVSNAFFTASRLLLLAAAVITGAIFMKNTKKTALKLC